MIGPTLETKVHESNSNCDSEIAALTLMPFCQHQEDRISLSLLHVRRHQAGQTDLNPHSPSLARKHQASSVPLRLAFSESKRYLGGLGRRILWGAGLGLVSRVGG